MRKNINIMAFLTVIIALLFVAQPVSAQTITDLGTLPGGTYSAAYGINGAGQIVGISDSLSSTWGNATLWDPSVGTITDLGTLPGGTFSVANSINDLGQIVGFSNDATGAYNATIWNASTRAITDLGTLPGLFESFAYGININGLVVGYSTNYCRLCASIPPDGYVPTTNATLWNTSSGTITDLGTLPGGTFSVANSINDLGQIVGFSNDATGLKATLWNASTGAITDLGTLPGGTYPEAIGINDLGQIVGMTELPSVTSFNASLWKATGAITDLGTLPGFTSGAANDINDFGQIVGGSGGLVGLKSKCTYDFGGPLGECEGLINATLWNAEGASTDLGALPGFTISVAYSINNRGEIVGESYNYSSGTNNATLWKVSVPSTTPGLKIQEIITDLQGLVTSGTLNQGVADASIAKLNAVDQNLKKGNIKAAINELNAFINQVQAFIKSGKISSTDGQVLIAEAYAIIDKLK